MTCIDAPKKSFCQDKWRKAEKIKKRICRFLPEKKCCDIFIRGASDCEKIKVSGPRKVSTVEATIISFLANKIPDWQDQYYACGTIVKKKMVAVSLGKTKIELKHGTKKKIYNIEKGCWV